jgi:hypothetical protein
MSYNDESGGNGGGYNKGGGYKQGADYQSSYGKASYNK